MKSNLLIKKTDPLWGSQQVGTDSPRILGVGWDPRRNSFKLTLVIYICVLVNAREKSLECPPGRDR